VNQGGGGVQMRIQLPHIQSGPKTHKTNDIKNDRKNKVLNTFNYIVTQPIKKMTVKTVKIPCG
jgi:hypothetical protein